MDTLRPFDRAKAHEWRIEDETVEYNAGLRSMEIRNNSNVVFAVRFYGNGWSVVYTI